MKKKNWKAWVALALVGVFIAVGSIRGAVWALYMAPVAIILGFILAILAHKDPATKNRKFTKFVLIFYSILMGITAFALIGLLTAFIRQR